MAGWVPSRCPAARHRGPPAVVPAVRRYTPSPLKTTQPSQSSPKTFTTPTFTFKELCDLVKPTNLPPNPDPIDLDSEATNSDPLTHTSPQPFEPQPNPSSAPPIHRYKRVAFKPRHTLIHIRSSKPSEPVPPPEQNPLPDPDTPPIVFASSTDVIATHAIRFVRKRKTLPSA
ncbi:hypothetical protein ACLOJK_036627 [Asimina triloba]